MHYNRRLLEPLRVPTRRPPRLTLWTVLSQVMQLAAIGTCACFLYLFYEPAFDKSYELKRDIQRKDIQIAEAQKELERLNASMERLDADPSHIAREARDTLGLARPNEIIFRFEPYRPGTLRR